MSDIVRKKLQEFYDTHWPIPKPHPLSDAEIRNIGRLVWYCNCSENPIPELQKFNKIEKRLEYPSEEDSDLLSNEFYRRGDKSYRVYPCGHAFLDIHLLCSVFDSFAYSSNKEEIPKIFESMGKTCPMCSNEDRSAGNVQDIYGISGQYVGGTVHVKTTIPKDMLPYLKPVYSDGDVIDCGGYRGLDLWIMENGEFIKVKTIEYYPIWSFDRAQKYGYRKLLSGLIWNGQADFDRIELDHGLKILPWCGIRFQDKEIQKVDQNDDNSYMKVMYDANELSVAFNGTMRILEKVDKFYRINKPFNSGEEFAFYLGIGVPLQIKVSDYDYLTIDPAEEYEYDGDIKTHETIYFTDLDGENRLDITMW